MVVIAVGIAGVGGDGDGVVFILFSFSWNCVPWYLVGFALWFFQKFRVTLRRFYVTFVPGKPMFRRPAKVLIVESRPELKWRQPPSFCGVAVWAHSNIKL
jgi:hypothetical protein